MTPIASALCAWLTTLRGDGSPHTTPVWFILIEDVFWIATAATNVKVRNLAGDARVSVAIDGSGASPHVAHGRARTHEAIAKVTSVASLFAGKYDGWDVTDSGADGQRVLLEIPVDRWLLAAGR